MKIPRLSSASLFAKPGSKWLAAVLTLLSFASLAPAQDEAWNRFSFAGDPWDKHPAGSAVSSSLKSLAQSPLGPGYVLAIPSRRQALETIDDAGLLDELRRDVSALLALNPQNVSAAFILAELDEYERDDVFHSPSVQLALPAWLKLERKGTELIASISPDGTGWRELTRQQFQADKLFAGLFVQSGDKGAYATATIDSVDLQFPLAGAAKWESVAIGEVPGPPRFSDNKGTWTVAAVSGAKAMEGGGVSTPIQGDGTLTARINGLEGARDLARAGLLFTDSIEKPDRSAFLAIRPDGNISLRAEGTTIRAVASLEYLGSLLPKNEAVTIRRARALYYSKQYDQAVELLLPLLQSDPGPVFTLDFEVISRLINRGNLLGKVADALIEWKNRPDLTPMSIARAGPFLVVMQYLRDRGDQAKAISLLEVGIDQLGYEDDLYLLSCYLQLLDEAGRLKEGESRLLSSLLEKDAERNGARRTGFVLSTPMLDSVSREELARIQIILSYARKMGALPKLLEAHPMLEGYSTTDLIILGMAAALLQEEKYLPVLEELLGRINTDTIQPDESELISRLGEMLYHSWPAAKELAFQFLGVPPISAGEGGYQQRIKILHRLAEAARLEEDWDTALKAAERAAHVRMNARQNGFENTYEKQAPPIEFKTAQLLRITGSEIDPHLLLEPYVNAPLTLPSAEQTLSQARVRQVLARLDGKPYNPAIVAFTVPGEGESKLGIEMAPGPLHGAHNAALRVGQPVKPKEFDKQFDWRIWSGSDPHKLELGETIEAAPSYFAKEWRPGLSYVKLGFRPHGSKEPFQDMKEVYPIGIGRNLSPDPVLSGIKVKTVIETPVVEGWTDVPPGLIAAGDPGPLPGVPTLRFVSRHSEDTVHLEMNRIPVKPGKRYFQSIWLRSPPRPGTVNLGMRFLDANGKSLGISRCAEDYDDPRWLLTSQLLAPKGLEQGGSCIPEGTAFLQPVLSIWCEADWCGHFVCEVD